ncbi:MAG: malonate decarboxylase subunit epsilon [Zoogloea sp.]|nr:malonate decarboxylase subunit epsilon [Zoogloea sp.]
MRLAILFSGQGGQQPEHVAQLRERASPALATRLAETVPSILQASGLTSPDLQPNRLAQPLIFAWQMSMWQAIQPHLPRPVCVAGYSLGEMAACCAAGAFPADAGVALCAERAELMDACVDGPAGLLAIIGLHLSAIEGIAGRCGLVVAIRNGPDHFVLGGAAAGLAQAQGLAEAQGAGRVVRLGVTTPSHTPLLAPAAAGFAGRLAAHRAGRLAFPVLSAIDGRSARTAADALDALARQICTPLDWDRCLGAVEEMQPDVVLEIGPGNALVRMWSERCDAIVARAADDFRTTAGLIDWVRSRG